MNMQPTLDRDERTVAVENASYRFGYLLLGYAILVDVMYRGYVRHEAAWDLVAALVLSGCVCRFYQARQKTLTHNWAMKAVFFASIAAIMGAALAMRHWWAH